VGKFNIRICDLLELYEPWLGLNMDETVWKLINMNLKRIAENGFDDIHCWFIGDSKSCVAAVVRIDAAGETKPWWIIARGVTE
jgi:hypothetical protein